MVGPVADKGASRRAWLRCVTGGTLALTGGAAAPLWAQARGLQRRSRPLRVTFLNPGHAKEAYWSSASQAMQQAARSLGITLEVLYGERDHWGSVRLANDIAQRPQAERPDYVICCNEYSAGPELLRVFQASGIPCFLAFSGIHDALREITGKPRERYPHWLGSLEPDAEAGGYMTAHALMEQALRHPQLRAPDGLFHLLSIQGDRSTPSSMARNQGMRRALSEYPQVRLLQEVVGEWRRDKAHAQAQVLYKRHPHARLVWCGNDLMAFGAMQAWREQGGRPGEDALFSGINTSSEALQAVRDGSLSVLAGGHFMTGAWALVMLFDHAHGIDFVNEGLEMRRNMFVLFDAPLTERFEQRLGDSSFALDFRRYSKLHQPRLQQYQFDIQALLKG